MLKANDMKALADSKKQPHKLDYSLFNIIEKNILRAAEEGRYNVVVTLPYVLDDMEKEMLAETLKRDNYTLEFAAAEGFFGSNVFIPAKTVLKVGW